MMFSTRNVRLSKMRTLISGDSVRRSTAKNTISSSTPTAMLSATGMLIQKIDRQVHWIR